MFAVPSEFTVMSDETAFRVCQQEHRKVFDLFVQRIATLMDWAPSVATLWMTEINPMLGGVSPVSMIAHGRATRLEKFIREAEEEHAQLQLVNCFRDKANTT